MTMWGSTTALQKLPTLGSQPVELVVESEELSAVDSRPGLSAGLRGLWERGELCDVSIVVAGASGDQIFPAHAAVLASAGAGFCDHLRAAEALANVPPPAPAPPPEPAAPTTAEAAAAGSAGPGNGAIEVHSGGGRRTTELKLDVRAEAVKSLLDFVYGAVTEKGYDPGSDEANRDVLRLASRFGVSSLQESAALWLARNLNSANVVRRLATCKEFDLIALYETFMEQLVATPSAVVAVSDDIEIMRYPPLLQDLLTRMALRHSEGSGDAGKSSSSDAQRRKKARLGGAD